jgi:protein phosphatase
MPELRLRSAGLTDVGLRREHNEDYLLLDDPNQVFVLADGMGGHASGEVASQLAVSQFVDFFTRTCRQEGFHWPYDTRGLRSFEEMAVANGIQYANDKVFIESMRDRRYDGMGTTLVVIAGAKDHVVLAHVGDSRVYRYRDGVLTQLTEDHSLINHIKRTRNMTDEEARALTSRNVIVRAVGLKEYVEPDVQRVEKRPGDIYLLCSDGLSDLVDDWVLASVLGATGDDLDEACRRMVRLANQGGGKDNITVVLVKVEEVASRNAGATRRVQAETPADTDVSSVVIGANPGRPAAPQAGRAAPTATRAAEPEPEIPPPIPDAAKGARPAAPRGREGLRDTRPATPQMRVGSSRIGSTPAEPPPASPPESEGPDLADLRDTIRMPQQVTADLLREYQQNRARLRESRARATSAAPASKPPEAQGPTQLATLPSMPAAIPEPQGPPPPTVTSLGMPASQAGPVQHSPSAQAAPLAAPGASPPIQQPPAAANTRTYTLDDEPTAPMTSLRTVSARPPSPSSAQTQPSAQPAQAPSPAATGGELAGRGRAVAGRAAVENAESVEAPMSDSGEGQRVGEADIHDPSAVISLEELRAVFRKARVAPLPPLPPPDED